MKLKKYKLLILIFYFHISCKSLKIYSSYSKREDVLVFPYDMKIRKGYEKENISIYYFTLSKGRKFLSTNRFIRKHKRLRKKYGRSSYFCSNIYIFKKNKIYKDFGCPSIDDKVLVKDSIFNIFKKEKINLTNIDSVKLHKFLDSAFYYVKSL